MSTKWVVSNAAERITLDGLRHGETTFTVSNQEKNQTRAMFEVVPGDGADPTWFSVEEPMRKVLPAGSVSYLVKVDVAPTVAPGEYELRGRVYSGDGSAPEETSVLSGRVLVDVAGAAAPPPKKRRPWWLIAVAALVALVLGVVIWLIARPSGTAKPAAKPTPVASARPAPSSAAPTTPGPSKVPNLISLNLDQARSELQSAGLVLGTIKHRQSPTANAVLSQGTAATTTVPAGTKVDLTIGVNMVAATITAPGDGAGYGRGTNPPVRWTQTEPWATRWLVVTYQQSCQYAAASHIQDCRWDERSRSNSTAKEFATNFSLSYQPSWGIIGRYNTGPVMVTVTPWDEFDGLGPVSTVQFHIG